MNDPIAFLLTWATYGTRLPGDPRGWVERGGPRRGADLVLELECAARMSELACRLTKAQRRVVEDQIHETCRWRGWTARAVNCRSNHVHSVVTAPGTCPKRVRDTLKAWATKALKLSSNSSRKNWWAERGSCQYLWSEEEVASAVHYVKHEQDATR